MSVKARLSMPSSVERIPIATAEASVMFASGAAIDRSSLRPVPRSIFPAMPITGVTVHMTRAMDKNLAHLSLAIASSRLLCWLATREPTLSRGDFVFEQQGALFRFLFSSAIILLAPIVRPVKPIILGTPYFSSRSH